MIKRIFANQGTNLADPKTGEPSTSDEIRIITEYDSETDKTSRYLEWKERPQTIGVSPIATFTPQQAVLQVFSNSVEVAKITLDGIMRFSIDANDENAAKFVQCIEAYLNKRLTGIDVQIKDTK